MVAAMRPNIAETYVRFTSNGTPRNKRIGVPKTSVCANHVPKTSVCADHVPKTSVCANHVPKTSICAYHVPKRRGYAAVASI
jgi:hypothetical protein